jgi:hypothetical protein
MKLLEKYINYINDASTVETELILFLPIGIFAYLFFPNVNYTAKLLIFGVIASLISIFHFALGVKELSNRKIMGAFNLLILPAILFAGIVGYGHGVLRF